MERTIFEKRFVERITKNEVSIFVPGKALRTIRENKSERISLPRMDKFCEGYG